ncbi:MAG: rhomboid family intramembrane serine protease [Lachnospiraceae bacterium]|nr:rhomboid family intramembrane serine protease [Lachnospiraceae bacterium]
MIDIIKKYYLEHGYKEFSRISSNLLCRETEDSFYNVLLVRYSENVSANEYIESVGNIKGMQRVTGAFKNYPADNVKFLCIMVFSDGLLDDDKRQIIEHIDGLWVVAEDSRSVHVFENQPEEFDSSMEGLKTTVRSVKKPKPFVPWMTAIIILSNIIIFFGMYFWKNGELAESIVQGYADSYKTVIENREWYRLFTAMFLHGGTMHLYSNMLLLGFLGYDFEKKLGRLYFVLLYLGTGLASSLGSVFYHYSRLDPAFSLGASGAIMGVLGALCVIAFLKRKEDGASLFRRIVFYLGYCLAQGMLETNVDNMAHLFGFIAGGLFAFLTKSWIVEKEAEKDSKISA